MESMEWQKKRSNCSGGRAIRRFKGSGFWDLTANRRIPNIESFKGGSKGGITSL